MKNLVLFAAAFAATAALQAAQLDWSLAGKTVKTQSGANGTGITAYLMGFESAAAADTYYASLKDGSVTLATATGAAIDSATTSSGKVWGSVTKTATSPSLTEGAVGYYALLFTEKVGDQDYFMLSGAASGQAYDPAGTIETEGKAASFDGSMFGAAGSRSGWTAVSGGGGDVPEPTSGLLLLVGGAMLALRRKQK